jgi:hypothetical protein
MSAVLKADPLADKKDETKAEMLVAEMVLRRAAKTAERTAAMKDG